MQVVARGLMLRSMSSNSIGSPSSPGNLTVTKNGPLQVIYVPDLYVSASNRRTRFDLTLKLPRLAAPNFYRQIEGRPIDRCRSIPADVHLYPAMSSGAATRPPLLPPLSAVVCSRRSAWAAWARMRVDRSAKLPGQSPDAAFNYSTYIEVGILPGDGAMPRSDFTNGLRLQRRFRSSFEMRARPQVSLQ